jgi:hypothetical protein
MWWGSERIMTVDSLNEIGNFLKDHAFDMPTLFKAYNYDGDSYREGFPKMFVLERRISYSARNNLFDQDDLMKIAEWGHLRNKKPIEHIDWKFKITLYVNNAPARWLKDESGNIVSIVKERIPGYGATFSSKLLHFAVPSVFGMLDTWLVRTFGEGDPDCQKYKFLKLEATNPVNKKTKKKSGWAISTSPESWPSEYGTWIQILNNISCTLNDEKIKCPHPLNYIQSGLRKEGVWYPADVETALFSYAYEGRGENIIKKSLD